jgi:hypothetical protein
VIAALLTVVLLTRGGDSAPPVAAGASSSSESRGEPVGKELEGRWFLAGPPVQCVGLSSDDCAGFQQRGARFVFRVTCVGDTCAGAIGTSKPGELTGADPITAEGDLDAGDGFSCLGQPDPTRWRIEIDDPGDGPVTSFKATATLTSQDGATDGNTCVFEQLIANVVAQRQA